MALAPELKRYGLKEPPFSLSPDPRFLYLSPQHEMTIAKTEYVINNKQGLKVIFGDIGLGKTTLVRRICDNLRDDPKFEVAYIPTPRFKSEHQLMCAVAGEFGVTPKRSGYETMKCLEDSLINICAEGKTAVLIVDEAQLLVGQMFELLRQFLNFETNDEKLLQIILAGQMELRDKLRLKKALLSRVAMQSTLEAFDPETMQAMINFRLKVAGRDEPLFTDDAYNAIYAYSRGVLRKVVKLCMGALPLGAANRLPMIDARVIAAAIPSVPSDKPEDEVGEVTA